MLNKRTFIALAILLWRITPMHGMENPDISGTIDHAKPDLTDESKKLLIASLAIPCVDLETYDPNRYCRRDITPVTFSHNNKRLAGVSGDGTIIVWDTQTHAAINAFKGDENKHTIAAFDPSDDESVAVADGETIKVWHTPTNEFNVLRKIEGDILCMAFSSNGFQLTYAGTTGATATWRCGTNIYTSTDGCRNYNPHPNIAFSPDGQKWAIELSHKPGTISPIHVFNRYTQECTNILKDSKPCSIFPVTYIIFSQDGKQLAHNGRLIKVWNLSTNECTFEIKYANLFPRDASPYSFAFSPNGQQFVNIGSDDQIKLWDLCTGTCIKTIKGGSQLQSVAFSHDGNQLATGSALGEVRLWDLRELNSLKTLLQSKDVMPELLEKYASLVSLLKQSHPDEFNKLIGTMEFKLSL